MPRARPGAARNRRKRRLHKAVKGFHGGRSKLFRAASEAYIHSQQYAFRDRRAKKRDYRGLWIIRLSAACKARGIQYSRFIAALNAANIIINRKMLSELAIHDPAGFDAVVELARPHLAKSAA